MAPDDPAAQLERMLNVFESFVEVVEEMAATLSAMTTDTAEHGKVVKVKVVWPPK